MLSLWIDLDASHSLYVSCAVRNGNFGGPAQSFRLKTCHQLETYLKPFMELVLAYKSNAYIKLYLISLLCF